MHLEAINKERVCVSMVRMFFHAFFSGLADALHPETRKFEPKELKQEVVNRYERLSIHFLNVTFPILIRVNFDDIDTVVQDMQKRHFTDETSPKIMLRYACGTKEIYASVTEEYKNQMAYLLEGRFQSTSDFLANCQASIEGKAMIAVPLAIRSIVRTVMQSYALGVNTSKSDIKTLHQATIYRLMIQAMTILLHKNDVEFDQENLEMMFRKVCLNSENFEILMNEMNQAYEDLAQ